MDAFGEFVRGFEMLASGAAILLAADFCVITLIRHFKHRR